MPNSHYDESDYTCYACGEVTKVQTWLIIDATEQPDLIESVKDETIWDITCPGCGESITHDLPLLLYFPEDEPRFLFASRPNIVAGYPEMMIKGLFDQLVECSGDQELKEQYRDHRAWVLKEDLADRLKDYPEIPLVDFDWTAYPELKQLEMTLPDEYFQMVMTTYFENPDWNEKKKVTDLAPLVMPPAVEPWLEAQEEAFREMGNDQNLQIIQDHLGILTRAREIGYYQAVLEFQEEQGI